MKASFSRHILRLLKMGLNSGPRIRLLPESVKNMASPAIQTDSWALNGVSTNDVIFLAKDFIPPDCSTRYTKPPMMLIMIMTRAFDSLASWAKGPSSMKSTSPLNTLPPL